MDGKMKSVEKLQQTDFRSTNGEVSASCGYRGKEVTLSVGDINRLTSAQLDALKHLLREWDRQLPFIANEVQSFVQKFLPGRKVISDELHLWNLELMLDGQTPHSGTFRCNLAGEYDDPRYKLDEFDSDSVLEIETPLKKGVPDFSNIYISSTNDFD